MGRCLEEVSKNYPNIIGIHTLYVVHSDISTLGCPAICRIHAVQAKIRGPGTGCVTMINDHLYEGRYTPTNAYGKRESHNIYATTREECEEKLKELIAEMKKDIAEIKAGEKATNKG